MSTGLILAGTWRGEGTFKHAIDFHTGSLGLQVPCGALRSPQRLVPENAGTDTVVHRVRGHRLLGQSVGVGL